MVNLERRFSALQRLYGVRGAEHIRSSHIAVAGLGGVGSWTAEALVRSGVGELTLIDFDQIAESNVNRQLHALTSTIGQAKVFALQQRFDEINPDCIVHAVEEFVEPPTNESEGNWPEILGSTLPTAIIDATDQVKAKCMMAAWALKNRVPFISVGAAGGKQLAHAVEVGDLAEVTHDPLLAQMRYRLRKEYGLPKKGRMKVTCVFSREEVKQPDASCLAEGADKRVDGSLNCAGYGSAVSVTAVFGMVASGKLLADLAKQKA